MAAGVLAVSVILAMLIRYGYGSAEQLGRVVDSYAQAGIPLETFVTDSQYMDKDQDFTFSLDFSASEMKARAHEESHLQFIVHAYSL